MDNQNYDHISNYIESLIMPDPDNELYGNNSNEKEKMRLLISDFAILWNMFENKYFSSDDETNEEKKFIDRIETNVIRKLDFTNQEIVIRVNNLYDLLKDYFDYRFHNQMITPKLMHDEYGGPTYKYKELMASNEISDKLYYLIIVCYRVRNRMFHGDKEISLMFKYKKLFHFCNELLYFLKYEL